MTDSEGGWSGNGPATLADLSSFVITSVRRIGKHFKTPQDDWVQVLFVQTPNGVELVTLANEMFASDLSKDMLGEVLRRLVVVKGAYRYALLLNAHMLKSPEPEEVERFMSSGLRIEQMESAVEVLTLVVGDAEIEEMWLSEIERTPRMIRRPGPWAKWQTDTSHTVAGRFCGLNEYMRTPRRKT